jgi:hypothetical protein
MLPLAIFSFIYQRNLAIIVEVKRLQKQVTYFCTRPLLWTLRIQSNGVRVEHPLVVWSSAPDNKREEQSPSPKSKFTECVAHPRPR